MDARRRFNRQLNRRSKHSRIWREIFGPHTRQAVLLKELRGRGLDHPKRLFHFHDGADQLPVLQLMQGDGSQCCGTPFSVRLLRAPIFPQNGQATPTKCGDRVVATLNQVLGLEDQRRQTADPVGHGLTVNFLPIAVRNPDSNQNGGDATDCLNDCGYGDYRITDVVAADFNLQCHSGAYSTGCGA